LVSKHKTTRERKWTYSDERSKKIITYELCVRYPLNKMVFPDRQNMRIVFDGNMLEYTQREFLTTQLCLVALVQNPVSVRFIPRQF
jgi:hypothetical protein